MDKESPVKKRLFDLNELPEEDVHPPLELYVDLSFPNEDVESLRKKYRFMGSSLPSKEQEQQQEPQGQQQEPQEQQQEQQKNPSLPEQGMGEQPAKENPFECLWSLTGPVTLKSRDKQHASMKVNKEEKVSEDDRLAAKELLREFVEQAKARARMAREEKEKKKKKKKKAI